MVGSKTITLTVIFADGRQRTVSKVGYVTVTVGSTKAYLDLLISQFKDKTSWTGILTPFIDQLDDLCFVADDLIKVRDLSNVAGVDLDALGELLGLPRLGRADSVYRLLLLAMPFINRGYGQLETLIKYTALFLNSDLLYVMNNPGTVTLDVVNPEVIDQYALFRQRIQQLAAAGVRVVLTVSDADEVPLEFEDTGEPPDFLTGNEWSEEDYEDDGYLAEEY
jgi:hypothetical protein